MRKINYITLQDGGEGKTFQVQQMSALHLESWINRLLIMLAGKDGTQKMLSKADFNSLASKLKGGIANVENQFTNLPVEKVIGNILSLLGSLDYEKVEPLYNELLTCCAYVPNPDNRTFINPLDVQNVDAIISDVKTLYMLRLEALKINFSFFAGGDSSPKITHGKKQITIKKTTKT